MSEPATISPSIVEALYEDALQLAEEARVVFDYDGAVGSGAQDETTVRVAISCEALRTTTRMMHGLAWLLNQRAYFAGEITELQLRRNGQLPVSKSESDPGQRSILPQYVRDMVDRSEAFYARIERLDRAWRDEFEHQPATVHRLRERLGGVFAAH